MPQNKTTELFISAAILLENKSTELFISAAIVPQKKFTELLSSAASVPHCKSIELFSGSAAITPFHRVILTHATRIVKVNRVKRVDLRLLGQVKSTR